MKLEDFIPLLIRAGLDSDLGTIRAASTKLIRKIKTTNPEIAYQISEALRYNGAGLRSTRSIDFFSSPQDADSRLDLLVVTEPIEIDRPFYNDDINNAINAIIDERESFSKLMSLGLKPTSSILLYGEPGVGKTLLARYLSSKFKIKFASLNMASAVSSYLGKTGQNLKKAIDYAKEEPTLLLLDEFDAIAKRRDDTSDLGELKRVVNVLLKELEDWPAHSVLVAATNHAQLLDKAIWRRFDSSISIPLPNEKVREAILRNLFEDTLYFKDIEYMSKILSELLDGMSPADIEKACDRAKKHSILYESSIKRNLVIEIAKMKDDKSIDFNKKFCRLAKDNLKMTYKEMSEILGKSISAIQNYLK